MIFFLRNNKNQTIVDLEVFVKTENDNKFIELHCNIDIEYYSNFLLENLDQKANIISTFAKISELRGWLWERYFMGGKNDPKKYGDVLEKLRTYLKDVATIFDLYYVED